MDAVWNHVKALSGKDYSGYAKKAGHKTLDYVIMFIPNYGALQLAIQLDKNIWHEQVRNQQMGRKLDDSRQSQETSPQD